MPTGIRLATWKPRGVTLATALAAAAARDAYTAVHGSCCQFARPGPGAALRHAPSCRSGRVHARRRWHPAKTHHTVGAWQAAAMAECRHWAAQNACYISGAGRSQPGMPATVRGTGGTRAGQPTVSLWCELAIATVRSCTCCAACQRGENEQFGHASDPSPAWARRSGPAAGTAPARTQALP